MFETTKINKKEDSPIHFRSPEVPSVAHYKHRYLPPFTTFKQFLQLFFSKDVTLFLQKIGQRKKRFRTFDKEVVLVWTKTGVPKIQQEVGRFEADLVTFDKIGR